MTAAQQCYNDLNQSRTAYVTRSGRRTVHTIFSNAKRMGEALRQDGIVPSGGAVGGFTNITINSCGGRVSLNGIKVRAKIGTCDL